VRSVRKDVPPQLERIVMRALAKRAGDRYQSAGDMATDLERFLHGYSPVFSPTKLAGHLGQALGTEPEAVEIEPTSETTLPAPNPRRMRSDSAIRRNTLVTARSELGDENSVIFRVGELQAAKRPPDPQAARASPRMITASTLPIADGDEVDSTVVTGRPDEGPTSFDGPRGLRKAARAVELGDDYEPTVVEARADESNDAPPPTATPSRTTAGRPRRATPSRTRWPRPRPRAVARRGAGRRWPPARRRRR
jgi:hypothetical protein